MALNEEFSLDKIGQLTKSEFIQLSEIVYKNAGIHLAPAKKVMLESRLYKRLRVLCMDSFQRYISYVMSKEGMQKELLHMIDAVTTNKTDFFREPHHFEFLSNDILLPFVEHEGQRMFRVWSAACSTGEEPYTLAMVLQEFASRHSDFQYNIIATDISSEVVQRAQQAIYRHERIASVPLSLRKKYLLKRKDAQDTTVKVIPELRQKIRFARLNLMDALQEIESDLDAVFCRNVLIYFDRPTQQQVLRKVVEKLKPTGYLFIGHSESLYQLDLPLVQVKPTIYKKK